MVEKWFHPPGEFLHQFVVGEQHERLAVGLFYEMPDPMFQRVGVTGLARVWHFLGDKNLHLPLVIKRCADLKLRGGFGADAAGEIP